MKSVLNPETNEVLGFDDNMSDDQIGQAIQSDKDGKPQADVNPTPYDTIVKPALEQAKITGNNDILYAARARANAEDPFNKAILHGLTFGLTPDNDAQTKIANPTADILGNLGGQTASILGTAGLGEFIGAGKLAAGAGEAAAKLLPQGIKDAVIGSGEVLVPTAGKVIASVAQGVTGSAILGAMYNGITESVKQGKGVFGNENGDVEKTAPDLVKIGQNILTAAGKGAVSWAPYGVGGAFVADTASGISAGTAATAGTAYVVSKADGQSEADARFNAMLLGIFHFVSHATASHPTETPESAPVSGESPAEADLKPADNIAKDEQGKPIEIPPATGLKPEERTAVVENLQNLVADYTKAKNGMTEGGNVHQMVGDELVKSEAQNAIDQSNEETAARPDITKVPDEKPEISQQFKDPYAVETLDYLAQYIPPKEVASMAPEARLALANAPWQELRDTAAKYESGELPDIFGKKMARDANLARTQDNTFKDVTSSDTLTKALTSNVTKKMIESQKATDPEVSTEGAPSEVKGAAIIPDFKGTTEAMMFGRTNKDNPDIIQQLQDIYDANTKTTADLRTKSEAAVAAGDIPLSDKYDSEAFALATKNQLYREAVEGAKGAKTVAEKNAEKSARETSVKQDKNNQENGFTETKKSLQSIYDKNLPRLQDSSGDEKEQILQSMSREAHETLSKNPSFDAKATTADDLSKLLQGASKTGKIDENAVRNLLESRSTNAPSRLQKSSLSDLALQEPSSATASKEPYHVEHGNEEKEKGVSKIAQSINAKAVEDKLTKGFENLAGYDKINIKDQAQKATKLIGSDLEKSRSIIRGEEPLPDGLKGTALITAMEEHLKNNPDADIAQELANSPLVSATSEAAQELRLAAERTPDSATSKLSELKKSLVDSKGGEEKVSKAKKDIVKQAKAEMNKINLSKEELSWDKFLGDIEC